MRKDNLIEDDTELSVIDVMASAKRLHGFITKTPLLENSALNTALGFRLLIKAENTQLTGSFKVRGAFNQLLQLTDEEKQNGIIAISSGNHAQAVAYAAAKLGIHATIVMPSDAPKMKIDNTRSYGAKVILYNRATEDREDIGRRLASQQQARMIHPYNDPRTIAGQGTIGIEILQQTRELGSMPDAIIVNCSGGGLSSGIALTRDLYDVCPTIYTAEPALFDDMQRSLISGRREYNTTQTGSICDALMANSPGTNTFPILQAKLAQGLSATDDDTKAAMAIYAEYFKLVVEPGGAMGLACACLNPKKFSGKTVVVIASGGNIDPSAYVQMLHWGNKNKHRLLPELPARKLQPHPHP